MGGRRITGGGIFASLTRRRSGEGQQQQPSNQSGDGAGAPATPSPSAVLSPPERSRGKGGGGGGVGAGWLRPNSAATQAASKAFFGAGEDDAGHDSWSSTDEDEGNRPGGTQSYIRVTCTARTSYKLFSTNPQVRGGVRGVVPFFLSSETYSLGLKVGRNHDSDADDRCKGSLVFRSKPNTLVQVEG